MSQDWARLFVSLWPTPDVAHKIIEVRRSMAREGKPVSERRLHLTVGFIGAVERRRAADLAAALEGTRVPAFTLTLQRLGYFANARSLWIGPSCTPAALSELREAVQTSCRLTFDTPFVPHLTLARKVRNQPCLPNDIEPIAWRVDEFELTESTLTANGPLYRTLGRWTLR